MSNFDKMIKLIEEKDIKGMEEWLHPDFLFVVDYEMETRGTGLRKQIDYQKRTNFQSLTLNYCTKTKMLLFMQESTMLKGRKELQ